MFEDYYKMYSMEQSWFRKTHKKILICFVIYQITINYSCEQDIHIQGVPTRYDILWSPRWPTKVDFQVQKKVAAHLGDGDIWVSKK